jgi:general stress protein YciG
MTEPKKRGFAAMSPEKRAEISSLGGKAAHRMGKAHKFTTEEAAMMGRRGGLAAHAKKAAEAVQ